MDVGSCHIEPNVVLEDIPVGLTVLQRLLACGYPEPKTIRVNDIWMKPVGTVGIIAMIADISQWGLLL